MMLMIQVAPILEVVPNPDITPAHTEGPEVGVAIEPQATEVSSGQMPSMLGHAPHVEDGTEEERVMEEGGDPESARTEEVGPSTSR
jgi:hypothetical protein